MTYVQIGVLKLETEEFCPVYVDLDKRQSSGEPLEAFVYDGLDSAYILSNILVSSVTEFNTPNAIKLAEQFDADGVVVTDSHFVTFKDGIASWRPCINLQNPETTSDYDTDAVYEDFDVDGTM